MDPASATERLLRVARIPTTAGTLELTMVAEPGTSADGTFAFNQYPDYVVQGSRWQFESPGHWEQLILIVTLLPNRNPEDCAV